jgi:hypothetical protein
MSLTINPFRLSSLSICLILGAHLTHACERPLSEANQTTQKPGIAAPAHPLKTSNGQGVELLDDVKGSQNIQKSIEKEKQAKQFQPVMPNHEQLRVMEEQRQAERLRQREWQREWGSWGYKNR